MIQYFVYFKAFIEGPGIKVMGERNIIVSSYPIDSNEKLALFEKNIIPNQSGIEKYSNVTVMNLVKI